MSRKKDYNKGLEAGARGGLKISETVIKQEKEALDRLNELIEIIAKSDSEKAELIRHLIMDVDKMETRSLFSVCNKETPYDLDEHEKMLLLDILATLSVNGINDNQRGFQNNVRRQMSVQGYMPNKEYEFGYVENLEIVSHIKIIVEVIRTFLYLQNNDRMGIEDHNADLFSNFQLNKKSFEEIDATIELFKELYGIEGLVEMYGDYESEEDSDDEEISDDTDGGEPDDQDNLEMEDIIISSIVQIVASETKKYKYKRLHFSSFMRCEGNLEINHCVIYYNEKNERNEISLVKGARLHIKNSIIICKGFSNNPFISCEGGNDVVIEKTTFVDCTNFIKSEDSINFLVTYCRMDNCYENFISVKTEEDFPCELSHNVFRQDELAQFNKNNAEGNMSMLSLDGESDNIRFFDNIIEEKASFRDFIIKSNDWNVQYRFRFCYLSSSKARVEASTFIGLLSTSSNQGALDVNNVSDCMFIRCKGAFTTKEKSPTVDNCVFQECQGWSRGKLGMPLIEVADDTTIKNCRFVSCKGRLIVAKGYSGGVNIRYSEFYNICHDDKYDYIITNASIALRRGKDTSSKPNYVEKCVFDGVKMGEAFLLAAMDLEKPAGVVTYVKDCDFKHCTTKRTSGKLIKEYIQFDSLLKKNQDFHANELSDCRGLDMINREGDTASFTTAKTRSQNGEKVGAALDIASSDGVGATFVEG